MNRNLYGRAIRRVVGVVILLSPALAAQEFDEKFEHWPVDVKINGRVVIGGALSDISVLKDALRRLGSDGKVTLLLESDAEDVIVEEYKSLFEEPKKDPNEDAEEKSEDDEQRFTVVRCSEDLASQLSGILDKCDVFCWHTSGAIADAQQSALHKLRESFEGHLASGGTIISVGPATELFSALYNVTDEDYPAVRTGLNLVPDCVIQTGYENTNQARGRLLSVLAVHSRSVGIGIEKDTAVVLSGRKMRVVGTGKATFLLMANERQPVRMQTIAQQQSPRQRPQEYLVDLTEWRRDAIDRTIDQFPPAEPKTPFVENGSLVIVGGGGMPKGLMERFVDLAGGPDNAKLVYVPCAEQDEVSQRQRTVESWHKTGVKHATFIHTKDRNKANGDDEFLTPLTDATGIWFGGGRQWNFSDSYYGTEAHRLMKEVVRRGGVIGGSSAGASIQARYLARATPIGNFRIMAPGYERGGLGFISGVAIDQHFSQRGRQKDMTQLVNRYPQMLGIGIDEATAIVVQKSVAEVVGRGKVHFYDRTLPVYPDRPDYTALPAGSSYDLAARQVLTDTSEKEPPATEKPHDDPQKP